MRFIDFTKLNQQCLDMTMVDVGITDFNGLSLSAIFEWLELGSNEAIDECFPVQQHSGKIDLSVNIQNLRQQKKVTEVIGSAKVLQGIPICFSILIGVGAKPKEYLKQYIEVAKTFCESSPDSKFVIWMEDTLTIIKSGCNALATQQAADEYRVFFYKEFPESQILVSSEVAPMGIPQDFAKKIFSINTEEFLSALPFHLRNPMFVKVLDIVHFAWNCYLLYRLPGIYLTCVNNKRHFQLFRKVVGQQITVVLLPLGSENFIG